MKTIRSNIAMLAWFILAVVFGKSFLFAQSFDFPRLYGLKSAGYLHIDAGLETVAENFDGGSVFDGSLSSGAWINSTLSLGYAFTSAHSVNLEVPWYFIRPPYTEDTSNNYHILGINAAYTYTKNISNIYFTVSPHIGFSAYQSADTVFPGSYMPDINRHNAGLSFGLMGPFTRQENPLQFLWNVALDYTASLPQNETWRPGIIKATGDITLTEPAFGGNAALAQLLLGVNQTVMLPQIIDNEWSNEDVTASTLIRLGGAFLFGQNMYFKALGQFSVYPAFASIFTAELTFGCRIQTRKNKES